VKNYALNPDAESLLSNVLKYACKNNYKINFVANVLTEGLVAGEQN
jgi:hypothetical protein